MRRMMTKKQKNKGFTLIEMIIVFTLIGILVGLGLPQYKYAVKRAREATLKENLHIMRTLLNQYYTDKKKFPVSLQTLVDDGYLKMIPEDPITQSSETWVEIQETLTEDDILGGVIPGIEDVTSGSELKALDRTFYKSW